MANRPLVYGLFTAALGIAFIGLFFGLRTLLVTIFNLEDITAISIATAAVILLFTPARRSMLIQIDRRIYGIKIDYILANPQTKPITGRKSPQTQIGNYTNLELIGSGGATQVYRARHATENYTVALKVLPPQLADEDEIFHLRFQSQARALTQLQHPNIARIRDFGEVDGTYYLAMEHISGHSLAARLNSTPKLPYAEVYPILTNIAAALDYAHAEGFVHHNIKPSNILLENGTNNRLIRAVLTDFSINKIITGMTRLTASKMVGTFDYIAPEQIRDSAKVNYHADIYALGIIAYRMLTGTTPFNNPNPGAVLMAHLMQPPPEPRTYAPDLSEATAKAIQRAIAKQPMHRFPSAGDFIAALQ